MTPEGRPNWKDLRFGLRPAKDDAEKHQRGILLANMRHFRAEVEQIFTDADYWNRAHPNEIPIDADPGGELRRIIDGIDEALLAEQERPL